MLVLILTLTRTESVDDELVSSHDLDLPLEIVSIDVVRREEGGTSVDLTCVAEDNLLGLRNLVFLPRPEV